MRRRAVQAWVHPLVLISRPAAYHADRGSLRPAQSHRVAPSVLDWLTALLASQPKWAMRVAQPGRLVGCGVIEGQARRQGKR